MYTHTHMWYMCVCVCVCVCVCACVSKENIYISFEKSDVYATSDLMRIGKVRYRQHINSNPIKTKIQFLEIPFK